MSVLEDLARLEAMALASLAQRAEGYRVPRLLHGVVQGYSPNTGADVTIEGSDVVIEALEVAHGYAGGVAPQANDVIIIHAWDTLHRVMDKIGQL